MKNTCLLLATLCLLWGCKATEVEGAAGPAGADGLAGANGADGTDVPRTEFSGSVSDGVNPVANAFIRLHVVNSDGEIQGTLAATETNENGDFSLFLTNISEPTSHLLYLVETEDGLLSSYLSSNNTNITPASTALSTLVTQIASSEGGVAVSDFTALELESLLSMAEAALATALTDQTNLEAVYTQVLTDVGEAVADATVSRAIAGALPTPTPEAPADIQSVADFSQSQDYALEVSNNAQWDVNRDGSISDGTNDAYDDMFYLRVNGEFLPSNSSNKGGPSSSNPSEAQGWIEDERELVLGPYGIAASDCNDEIDNDGDGTTDAEDASCQAGMHEDSNIRFQRVLANCNDGIDNDNDQLADTDDPDCATGDNETTFALIVTRKIHVGATGGWCRFVEFVTNPTDTTSTHQIVVGGNLGSDGYEDYGPSSSGDNIPDASDSWHTSVEDDGSYEDPALGFLYPTAVLSIDDDDLEFTYPATSILPGETIAIASFGFQDPTWGPLENIAAEISALESTVPNEYFAGLTETEIGQLVNLGGYAVTGAAGAVAPNAIVTIRNTNTDASLTRTARVDGSFKTLMNITAGDILEITTNLGRSETITAE